MREQSNVSLSKLTTLRLGGLAKRIVDADTEQETAQILTHADRSHEPLLVLGGGSNVVVDDDGWPGTVLRPSIRGIAENVEEGMAEEGTVRLRVGAGEPWDALVARCVKRGWAGLACLSGIPGWVGAAPIQNIGAYGHDVAEVLTALRAFDRQHRTFVSLPRDSCRFAYRSSLFRNDDRYVVVHVELALHRADVEPVRYPELARVLGVAPGASVGLERIREAVLDLRRSKGMVVDENDPESRSAGSFFVNPVVDDEAMAGLEVRAVRSGIVEEPEGVPRYALPNGCWKVPAAWLIEHAGFAKGTTVAGVGISRRHALALVNRGGKTRDLLALEETIRQGVRTVFGLDLSREPILVRYPRVP